MDANSDRVYAVVRYEDQWPIGRKRAVLGEGLTLEEAEKLAKENPPIVQSEDVVVERTDRSGAEAEVSRVDH